MSDKTDKLNQILLECKDIQGYLEVSLSDDPNELIERLTMLNTYLARSGMLLAEAKFLQDEGTAAVFAEHAKAILKMPATVATKFIASQCKDENYLVNWLERINRACVHQSDNLRTQVSFTKEQLKLTSRGY